MSAASHAGKGRWCEICEGDCTYAPFVPPGGPRYKDVCPHPQDSLMEFTQNTCGVTIPVTGCIRCGLAFPGQTKVDLLVA